GAERKIAFPSPQWARCRCRDRHQAIEFFAERIFVPRDGVEERGIVLQHGAGIFILRRARLAPDPFEYAADRVLVKALDGIFGRVADADHVDHGLDIGQRFIARRYGLVDGAEAAPEPENMSEIIEVAFA